MNWFTLLKQPELRTGSKVTTNLGIESENQKDDCERKVKEYLNKINNYPKRGAILTGFTSLDIPPLKRRFDSEPLPEEVYCKILSQLNRIQPKDSITEYVEIKDEYFPITYKVRTYHVFASRHAEMTVTVSWTMHGKFSPNSMFYFGLEHTTKKENPKIRLSEEEILNKVDFR